MRFGSAASSPMPCPPGSPELWDSPCSIFPGCRPFACMKHGGIRMHGNTNHTSSSSPIIRWSLPLRCMMPHGPSPIIDSQCDVTCRTHLRPALHLQRALHALVDKSQRHRPSGRKSRWRKTNRRASTDYLPHNGVEPKTPNAFFLFSICRHSKYLSAGICTRIGRFPSIAPIRLLARVSSSFPSVPP